MEQIVLASRPVPSYRYVVQRRLLAAAALLVACSSAPKQTEDASAPDPPAEDASPVMDSGIADASADTSKPPACTNKPGASGDIDEMLDVGGTMRHAIVHVPASYRATDAAPVVIVLHGFTEGPSDARSITHFDVIGEARGWITVFPEGTSGSWNGGVCCGVASGSNVDDVAFMRALVKWLEGDWCIDPKRVHAAGFSNGGFMAHRLACEMSDVVASIGVVAGQLGIPTCTPKRAVPVAQAHGTADPVVPYIGNPFLFYPPTMTTMNGWAMRDGCGSSPSTYATVGDATCVRWPSCANGADVALCSVANGVHEWFGGGTAWVDGGPPQGFEATGFLADFFAKHPML